MFIVHCYIDTRTIKRAQIIYALAYVHTVSLFELIPYIRKIDKTKDDIKLEYKLISYKTLNNGLSVKILKTIVLLNIRDIKINYILEVSCYVNLIWGYRI